MGKKLTEKQIAAFHRDVFVALIEVFSEQEAWCLRTALEAKQLIQTYD